MRIKVDVARSSSGWRVRILDLDTGAPVLSEDTGQPVLPSPRELRVLGDDTDTLGVFPLPPHAEAAALSADSIHRDLCMADDPAVIHTVYTRLAAREHTPDDVER